MEANETLYTKFELHDCDLIQIPRYDSEKTFGLPKNCLPISNSEIRESWCERKWLFRYGAGYERPIRFGSPLVFGDTFHRVIEKIHIFQKTFKVTEKNVEGFIKDTISEVVSEHDEIDSNDLFKLKEGINHATRSYIKKFGLKPIDGYRVVAVEQQLCFPFTDSDHAQIYADVKLVGNWESGWMRLMTPFEKVSSSETILERSLPMYHVGKIDFILQNKKTNKLVVGELKTSASPLKFSMNFEIDPQVSAYAEMLRWAVRNGWCESIGIEKPSGEPVEGYLLEVVYNKKTAQPKVLKSGGLSKLKNARICSWDYYDKIQKLGLKEEDYKDHLMYLYYNVDESLYIRKLDSFTSHQNKIFRYHAMNNGFRLKRMYEDLTQYKFGHSHVVDHIEYSFLRTQICRSSMYGCTFIDICHAKLPSKAPLDLMGFNKREITKWKKEVL